MLLPARRVDPPLGACGMTVHRTEPLLCEVTSAGSTGGTKFISLGGQLGLDGEQAGKLETGCLFWLLSVTLTHMKGPDVVGRARVNSRSCIAVMYVISE